MTKGVSRIDLSAGLALEDALDELVSREGKRSDWLPLLVCLKPTCSGSLPTMCRHAA